jgi:hypothetical protein
MTLDYHFKVEQEAGSTTFAFFGFNGMTDTSPYLFSGKETHPAKESTDSQPCRINLFNFKNWLFQNFRNCWSLENFCHKGSWGLG